VTTSRQDRFVENERLFRIANEGLRERVEDIVEPDQSIPFLCECIDETCMARIELTPKEYEMARSDDEWFVIARGHPLLDGERIVGGGRALLDRHQGERWLTAGERSEMRKDRLARNETLFREVNERVQEVGERAGLDMIDFICECGDADCTAAVSLTESEYEQIRADPLLFAILPGHAMPEVEDVVSEGGRFQVVRKHEEEEDIARATDPRA